MVTRGSAFARRFSDLLWSVLSCACRFTRKRSWFPRGRGWFASNNTWVTSLADPDGYRLEFESPTDAAEESVYSD